MARYKKGRFLKLRFITFGLILLLFKTLMRFSDKFNTLNNCYNKLNMTNGYLKIAFLIIFTGGVFFLLILGFGNGQKMFNRTMWKIEALNVNDISYMKKIQSSKIFVFRNNTDVLLPKLAGYK